MTGVPGRAAEKPQEQQRWPAAGGEAATVIRALDWSRTPIGSIETWPSCLKAVVDTALGCAFPMVVLWGRDLIQIYNDAYGRRIGDKHPTGMGQSTEDCWPELWAFSAPICERVLRGETVSFEDKRLALRRYGYLESVYLTLCYSPVRNDSGTIAGVLVTMFDTTGRVHAEAERKRGDGALRTTEARFRAVANLVPDLLWSNDPDGTGTWLNQRWLDYTGQCLDEARELDGWLSIIHPEDRPHSRQAFVDAMGSGLPLEIQHRMRGRDGRYRWFLVRQEPIRDEVGRIVQWFGAAANIHDIRQLQEQQTILVSELQHRTRNLLGVVQAVMMQTLGTSPSAEDFVVRFKGRLQALGRAQGMLARVEEDQITVRELLQTELTAHGAELTTDNIRLDGPEIPLPRRLVQTLALALHELATNAVKYGALARPAGTLAVSWNLAERQGRTATMLVLDWREDGVDMGRVTSAPIRRGYGTELIERALPYELDAEVKLNFMENGVRCRIAVPLR